MTPAWSRTTSFSSLLPSYAVYLGTNPKALQQVASHVVSPTWELTGLVPGTTYYWRVIARNHAGEATGPLWTFQT